MLILEQLIFYQNVKASIINAGDGAHEHPTQAFVRQLFYSRKTGKWGKKVVIVGDFTFKSGAV
jgi:aspartate carbamoyltransferase catalytic subunit